MPLSPLIPANARTQIVKRVSLIGSTLRRSNSHLSLSIWDPAFAGMSGT
jgi:hypothetical protein